MYDYTQDYGNTNRFEEDQPFEIEVVASSNPDDPELINKDAFSNDLKGKVIAHSLNVRESDSKDSPTLGIVLNGTEVEIVSEEGDWYNVFVDINGKTVDGYCMKEYIELV